MSEQNLSCSICKSKEFNELSYLYSHKTESIDNQETHILCGKCIKLNAKVCTCEKKFMDQEPFKISIECDLCEEEDHEYTENNQDEEVMVTKNRVV